MLTRYFQRQVIHMDTTHEPNSKQLVQLTNNRRNNTTTVRGHAHSQIQKNILSNWLSGL